MRRLLGLPKRTVRILFSIAARPFTRRRARALAERQREREREREHMSLTLERTRQSISAEMAGQFRGLREHVVAETNRLDGYLAYHMERLAAEHRDIAAKQSRQRTVMHSAPGGMAVIYDDFTFAIPSDQIGLVEFLMRHGHAAIEPGVQRLIRERLKPGDIAIDIGANFGLHAVAMARAVGSDGRVFCFEPQTRMANALEQTLIANGYADRTVVRAEAVSDKRGTREFHEAPHSPLSSFFASPQPVNERLTSVPTVSLDEAFAPGARVDFVKIDAEGAEFLIYRGMTRLIADNPQLDLVMEWSRSHFARAATDPEAFFGQLRQAGFHGFLVDGHDSEFMRPVSNEHALALEGANLYFTRRPGSR